MEVKIDTGIPERTKETIDNYVKRLWRPGGFVYAVLANDLAGAFGRADSENGCCMWSIVRYVYNNVPSPAWGSPEAVEMWLAKAKEL